MNFIQKGKANFFPPKFAHKTWLFMKLTTIMIVLGTLPISARTNGQKITFSGKDVTLKTLFAVITDQSGFGIFYKHGILDESNPVTLNVSNARVQDVLTQAFKNQPFKLEYTIEGNSITITRTLEHLQNSTLPTLIDIKGQILDERSTPLQGASITLKGLKRGIVSDANGMFELKQISSDAVLIISFTGYITNETNINNRSFVAVSLHLNSNTLDQTIIKGYYNTTQRLNTGNVSKIASEILEQQPVSNPLEALEGRVAGLIITQQTGVTGGNFTVQIRGQNSIANGNDPLYIIDGVPYPSIPQGSINSNNIIGGGNPLNNINISDIESIEILKDADATAIYGSRGANGIILISTKKGKSGNTTIDANFNSGWGKLGRMLNLLNSPQYLQMRHEAFSNDNSSPQSFNAPDLLLWDTLRNTNWQKQLLGGTSNINDGQLSISGGNNNTQFLIGTGLHTQTTVFPGDFDDRKNSFHFNLNHKNENGKYKMTILANYIRDENKLPRYDLTSDALTLPPDAPKIYNNDGSLNWENSTWINPLSQSLQKYKMATSNLIGNAVFSYQISKELILKANVGYNLLHTDELQANPKSSLNPAFTTQLPSSYFSTNKSESWVIEPQLLYAHSGNIGNINCLVGMTFEENKINSQNLLASGFYSDDLLEDIQAASSITSQSANSSIYHYSAIFGRVNYNLKEKYLLNFTGRRDGSSRFGPGKQFSNFGAIGAGWIFSEEPLFKKARRLVSYGKLRSSYGVTGNDQIGDYGYLNSYSTTIYPYQGSSALVPTQLYNANYGWETNRKLEFALEIGILKNRILFSASYFRNRSSNQLVAYPLPAITGFSSIQENLPAIVQNTGFEFSISSTNVKTSKFVWTTALNVAIPKNKLVAYPSLETSTYQYTYIIGRPLTIFRGYKFTGVDKSTGDYAFQDFDKDGQISFPNDFQFAENLGPRIYGGIENTFQYENFQLDIFLQFVKQTGRLYLYGFLPGSLENQPVDVLNRWQKPGDVSNIQRFNQDYSVYTNYANAISSSQNIGNASYARLKNISLSWTLPKSFMSKLHLQNGKIYVLGQNLLTFTSYKGLDPENQSPNNLPPLRLFTLGLKFTF